MQLKNKKKISDLDDKFYEVDCQIKHCTEDLGHPDLIMLCFYPELSQIAHSSQPECSPFVVEMCEIQVEQ